MTKPLVIRDPAAWQQTCQTLAQTRSLGFVPTMGALHQGHISLVERGLVDGHAMAVSIFVNPTQFNDPNDLAAYPRTLEADLDMLGQAGVAAVFLPEPAIMYPNGYRFRVIENEFSQTLCGANRPGHFDGVLTVVLKLLNLTGAAVAYFGEKDYQQLRLITDMTKAFFLPTQIIGCPIVREASGLAMSSRNQRLSPAGRLKAAEIYASLSAGLAAEATRAELIDRGFQVDYLTEIADNQPGFVRRLVAVWLEGVRLIDNLQLPIGGQS